MNSKRTVGRPRGNRQPRDITWPVKISDDMLAELKLRKEQDGVPVATQIFKAVERDLQGHAEPAEYPYISLLGEIPAGPAADIRPETPGVYIRPPFHDLPRDCYALTVHGKSMESEFGMTVKDGFYALFAPGVIFPHAIVHVEFSNGQFEHTATLKRYVPRGGGKAEFRPLNPDFEPIIVDESTFVIKGGFIKAWDGVSEE